MFPQLPPPRAGGWISGCLVMLICLPLHAADRPFLAWDATFKDVLARPGDTNVQVSFVVTNQSSGALVIRGASTSCGCSRVTAPARPWILKPGEPGQVTVTTDVRGKSGALVKTLMLETSAGLSVASYRITIQPPQTEAQRRRNLELAQMNRQAVFQGECAKCHWEPARGKSGRELFQAACGICHEAEHRGGMVPDLKVTKQARDRAYWLKWITEGKSGSLMPAFSVDAGGPLSRTQTDDLAGFLAAESLRIK